MTRAELHDDLARLETLVDEYAMAADLDPKRAAVIVEDILSLARAQRLDADVKIDRDTPDTEALRALDAHLCDLKEMQIRDGLHIFGRTPEDEHRNDLLVSIARLPRSEKPQDASLHRAIAADLGLGDFDPLTRDLAVTYTGPRPVDLADGERLRDVVGGHVLQQTMHAADVGRDIDERAIDLAHCLDGGNDLVLGYGKLIARALRFVFGAHREG
eukprot:gene6231-biopygen5285